MRCFSDSCNPYDHEPKGGKDVVQLRRLKVYMYKVCRKPFLQSSIKGATYSKMFSNTPPYHEQEHKARQCIAASCNSVPMGQACWIFSKNFNHGVQGLCDRLQNPAIILASSSQIN